MQPYILCLIAYNETLVQYTYKSEHTLHRSLYPAIVGLTLRHSASVPAFWICSQWEEACKMWSMKYTAHNSSILASYDMGFLLFKNESITVGMW